MSGAIRLAKRLGISVPETPSPVQEWELQTVAVLSGTAFDASYAKLEFQDHKQDIEKHKTEVSDGTNVDVGSLARKDLPTAAQAPEALARRPRSTRTTLSPGPPLRGMHGHASTIVASSVRATCSPQARGSEVGSRATRA